MFREYPFVSYLFDISPFISSFSTIMGWITSSQNSYIEALTPTQYLRMWLYLEIGSIKVVKLKWVIKVGPKPIWLVSSGEEKIWMHKEGPEIHTHRGKVMWVHREVAIHKPRRKALQSVVFCDGNLRKLIQLHSSSHSLTHPWVGFQDPPLSQRFYRPTYSTMYHIYLHVWKPTKLRFLQLETI